MSTDLGTTRNAASVLGAAVRRDRPATQAAVRAPVSRPAAPARTNDGAVFFGIVIMLCVSVLKIALRKRLSARHVVSLDLVMVSIGFVLLLMMRLPIGSRSGWIGAALFVSLPIFYRLLGYFEEPDE